MSIINHQTYPNFERKRSTASIYYKIRDSIPQNCDCRAMGLMGGKYGGLKNERFVVVFWRWYR